jgi:glycerol-3-phosphate dehydrogenase (NAD(P)+)
MAAITVLGAGTMGGAITIPLVENGHSVRLWGAW